MSDLNETIKVIKDNLRRNKSLSGEVQQLMEFGKVPPQAVELEEAVLGAVMIEKNAINEVIDLLKEESFYLDKHQRIWKAILTLEKNQHPIDVLTVKEQLKKDGNLDLIGGPLYLAQLTNKVATAANVKFHAHIIAEKHIQRELISVSTEIIKDAYSDTSDVFELLDKAERNLFAIAESNLKRDSVNISELLLTELKELDVRMNNNQDHLNGVPSGFTELDKTTGGWQKSDLIVVAGRPGMGKTAFTLALARNASVDYNKPVALFSLEMSSSQLVQRLISMETMIKTEQIRRGTLNDYEYQILTSKIDKLRNAPLFIDDTPAINIFELRSKCRRLKQQHGISLIIIDYLQLMSGTNDSKNLGNREQEISHISRSLKSLAKELDVPVIALSQLSRAPEKRGGPPRPVLSDLRESGAIEQDADIVIFLYRPEYYKIPYFDDQTPTAGIAEIIVAKHRNGPLKDIRLKFGASSARFENLNPLEANLEGGYRPQAPGQNYIIASSKINDLPDDDDFDFNRPHNPADFTDEPPFD